MTRRGEIAGHGGGGLTLGWMLFVCEVMVQMAAEAESLKQPPKFGTAFFSGGFIYSPKTTQLNNLYFYSPVAHRIERLSQSSVRKLQITITRI
jgi:hypothetical protein